MLIDGFDGLFDRLARRFRHSRRDEPSNSSMKFNGKRTGSRNSRSSQHGPGFFNNANNFVLHQPTLIENRISNFVVGTALDPVLERIMTCANLDASIDSSARFPPPTCHPGTRVKIGDTLFTWLVNPNRARNLIWLNGPAGTGKSAVAQTFAERCAKTGRLGASFFFSRPNERNDPNTVIPTLVYQLAVCNPHYKSLMTAQLVHDPGLLRKARCMQFQKLIVEPLSDLQMQDQNRIREPLLVVLDGLDECRDENAQREIVEMIGEVIRLKKDFPILWLICSRPEPHLKYLFSRADFTVVCGREKLVIDAESIADVDFYIRDGLSGIQAHFADVTTSTWPSEDQIAQLSRKASGHFGFAWTSLRYIGDPTSSAPMRRLDILLSFLEGITTGSSNPLEALDALYTAILDDIPKDVLPTTMQLLGLFIFIPLDGLYTVQRRCNFLRIDQATFYSAVRKLHSVIDIPPPESASQSHLHFYHASFEDYLRDPSRSGKFAIKASDVYLNRAKLLLSWYKAVLTLFHTTDGALINESHEHGILPGLLWVSDDTREQISTQIANDADTFCWRALQEAGKWDKALRSQIRDFDFRYIRTDELDEDWRLFVNKLWKSDSSSGIIRTEPHTEVDIRLLEYMRSMIGPLWHSRPATFPLNESFIPRGEYFFIGHGLKAVICWASGNDYPWCSVLNSDLPPSEERINSYQVRFKRRW